jgi:transposase
MIDSTLTAHIERAERLAAQAKSLDELQRAQAVLLTVGHKMTLNVAAKVIGRSPSWVAHARKAFIEEGVTSKSLKHGGRRNAILSEAEEEAFMDDACKRYARLCRAWFTIPLGERDEVQIHRVVRKMLEERAGRPIPNSTAFALMSRVGKRKFNDYSAYRWEEYVRRKFVG